MHRAVKSLRAPCCTDSKPIPKERNWLVMMMTVVTQVSLHWEVCYSLFDTAYLPISEQAHPLKFILEFAMQQLCALHV